MPTRKARGDISGNSVASAAAFERELSRVGAVMLRFESVVETLLDEEIMVDGMNVKTAVGGRAEYLLVVRALHGGSRFVVFCSGETLAGAVQNFVGRHQSGTLVWKADEYAK